MQNQCEQERSHILTNSVLALENTRLAGYMLTGNRSRFLETDGSVAWFYDCLKIHLSLNTMNQCYERILYPYRRKIQIIDPTTRQSYPHATVQICSDRIKNLFQIDTDQKNFWYSLTPGIAQQDKTAIFGSRGNNPIASHSFTG